MGEVTRRDLAGLAAVSAAAAGLAVSVPNPAQAATGADSLDALAKAKGFTGFGSCMGGGAGMVNENFGPGIIEQSFATGQGTQSYFNVAPIGFAFTALQLPSSPFRSGRPSRKQPCPCDGLA